MRRSRAATILLYCFFLLIVRSAGVQGTVILMVVFADEGVLKHIMVLQGLSHGLTEQAIAAARKIRFTPAMRDGKPISVNGNLEFYFSLY
jgi:periplasmic protein TonB